MTTVAVGTLWVCPTAEAQEPSRRTVLTIHSGSQFFPANPVMDDAIREVLMSRADIPVDYYAEYIETDRFGSLASEAFGGSMRAVRSTS